MTSFTGISMERVSVRRMSSAALQPVLGGITEVWEIPGHEPSVSVCGYFNSRQNRQIVDKIDKDEVLAAQSSLVCCA